MAAMRRSLARNIDGKHDSSWIRRETDEISEDNERLRERGDNFRISHDWLVREIERIGDAREMDPAEKIAILRQLREDLVKLNDDFVEDVEHPMDDNIEGLDRLREMASANAVEHGERISTLEQGDGNGLVDVSETVSDMSAEKTALEKQREEAAAKAAAQMAYLRKLKTDMLRNTRSR